MSQTRDEQRFTISEVAAVHCLCVFQCWMDVVITSRHSTPTDGTLSICCYCIYFNMACHIITVICHQAATSLRCNWLCTRPPLSLHYICTSLVSHTLLFPRYPRGNSAMVNATAEFEGVVDFPVGILGSDFIFVKAFIL